MGMMSFGIGLNNYSNCFYFMNKYLVGFLFGVIGGVFAFGLMKSVETKAGIANQVITPTPSPTPTPTPFDFWHKIVSDSALSTVAIQNFQNNKIKKQGNGIILSSDGLIVTTLEIASGGSIQVLYEDKILKGKLIYKDSINNLGIVKIENNNLSVSNLDKPSGYESGQEYMLTGKLANLSKPVIFSQKATIKYILDDKVYLDTNSDKNLNGAKAINHKGQTAGIVYVVGESVYLIKSDIINDFYKTFLNQ